jgi:hypothetical protein
MFFWVTVLLSEVEDVGKVEMSLPESIVTKCWECEVERVLYFLYIFFRTAPCYFQTVDTSIRGLRVVTG